jgi:hypothetical protein
MKTISHADAKKIFKDRYLGLEELAASSHLKFALTSVSEIPFSEEVLKKCADTHLLVFGPAAFADGTPVTLNAFRSLLGTDPGVSEPCMYNQDWYLKEAFAAEMTPGDMWHLVQKDVREDARAKRPDEIEDLLSKSEAFPSAVTCALAFFAYWHATGGERLWNHDFVWCSDRDHNGDRIYVGRYGDPTGINKNGFNIHRHLALRPSYSAVSEIIG